jgi:(1->4)-alpha-D-glucan 1-alpha-D-glucosylmutase
MPVSLSSPFIPRATYRLQLGESLTFDDARKLVDYFADLGIGALYLSPFFRAREGSTHGYDVVNHDMISPVVGDEVQFQALAETLRARGMGLVVDIVPNHMGIDDPHNLWWQDVLENGPSSPYASYFDIDWNPPKEALRGRVLLPVLGDQFGKVLEDQQLRLVYESGRFMVAYYDRRLPVDPGTWVPVLRHALNYVAEELEPEVSERMELESIITALEHLPGRDETCAERIQERRREKEVSSTRLERLMESSDEVRRAVERTMQDYNGKRGDLASFDGLDALLAAQAYRLCHWRVATDEINYRRFFDIDQLAAIRVEDEEVFEAVHAKVLNMVARGWVSGLRIDHADGLADPQQYLENLSRAAAEALQQPTEPLRLPLYNVVEKILAHDEVLPPEWLTHGTTGYDFLNLLNGVFVDRPGGYALRDIYFRFINRWDSWAEVLHNSKRTILSASLSAELYTLSHQLDRISEQHRWSRDFTRLSLFRALREVVASFPVYRTYIRPNQDEVHPEDRRRIMSAIRAAKRRNPAMSASFFDFIASVLLLEDPEGLSEEDRRLRRRFVLKFQQVTGPVTAKGLEDTAFYRYYPLASLNEVGGEPATPGVTVEHFHHRIQQQQADWPHTMLATGTHDTKRGEDIPEQWESHIKVWQAMNAGAREELDGEPAPDANEEMLIYQTLVGTWPLEPQEEKQRAEYIERIVKYLDKALREAKLHTSWTSPYEEYDRAVANFVRTILADPQSPFVCDLDEFVRSIADAGFTNGLAQLLVKLCAPGVPDFYRGVEFWDFNLVDPDNRRPVDFAKRVRLLSQLKADAAKGIGQLSKSLLQSWPNDRIKLFVTWRGLQLRAQREELCEGRYIPLECSGPRQSNVLAFARELHGNWTLCAVPRMTIEAWRSGVATEKSGSHGRWAPGGVKRSCCCRRTRRTSGDTNFPSKLWRQPWAMLAPLSSIWGMCSAVFRSRFAAATHKNQPKESAEPCPLERERPRRFESGPDDLIRWALPGTAAAPTSPFIPNTQRAWNCACSIQLMPRRKVIEFRSTNRPIWSGTPICQTCSRGKCTDTA